MSDASVNPPQWFDWASACNEAGRHLPHVSQRGCIYFITFRLADSIPVERLKAWKVASDAWLQRNPPPHTLMQERALKSLFSARIERYLDAGRGECLLAVSAAQAALEAVLRHDDGVRYLLGDFVVMPNHVHALVQTEVEIDELNAQWNRVSSHEINKALDRRGSVWQRESFDHAVRSREQLLKCQKYIRDNPARLAPGTYLLGKGKAVWAE